MKTAAIYCRVSTENQEREGSSLGSQQEGCVTKGQECGYNMPEERTINEVYSGLTLDRPKLTQLREWVRNKEIDAVIVYSTDRLSRDPLHLLLLAEEFDNAKAPLIFVTEPMDNSMEGQLLSYVRGWASKLEAVKIAERTKRGRRDRARRGKLPSASHARLYGYTYIRGSGVGEGIRYVNEQEAKWVREMFRWLVEERMSSEAITNRLRDLAVPTPSGKRYWQSCTVKQILKNPSYWGKTYAFTRTYGEPSYRLKANPKRKKSGVIWKPKEEWIEIPDATPPIISEELFNAAQERLAENRKMATRSCKGNYLLHGHVYCKRCGRAFWGAQGNKPKNGKHYRYPFYQCSGKRKKVTPVKCDNRQHNARKLEGLVWAELERILSQPELITQELEKRKAEQTTTLWERDLETVVVQLQNRQKQKDRIWKAFEITGDEAKFRAGIASVGREIQELQREKAKLENQIDVAKQFAPDIDDIKKACQLVADNLNSLSFDEKRLALSVLQMKILVDGDSITIQAVVPVSVGHVAATASEWRHPALRRGRKRGADYQAL